MVQELLGKGMVVAKATSPGGLDPAYNQCTVQAAVAGQPVVEILVIGYLVRLLIMAHLPVSVAQERIGNHLALPAQAAAAELCLMWVFLWADLHTGIHRMVLAALEGVRVEEQTGMVPMPHQIQVEAQGE